MNRKVFFQKVLISQVEKFETEAKNGFKKSLAAEKKYFPAKKIWPHLLRN